MGLLLVEDNADGEALTLRAFERNQISEQIVVARDGAAALDYSSESAAEGERAMPRPIPLDLILPRVDGSSKEQQDVITGYRLGCNSYVHKPVVFDEFLKAERQLGDYWLLLNEAALAENGAY